MFKVGLIGAGFMGGLIAVLAITGIVVWLCIRSDKKIKEEYALKR